MNKKLMTNDKGKVITQNGVAFTTNNGGTDVIVNGVAKQEVSFTSDPQTQITDNRTDIDNLINRSGTNISVDGVSQAKVEFVGGQPQTQIDSKLDKTQCTLDFNQLFDSNKSTLPSGSGLVISNIYGGHHVEGTTTSQFYHKMYSVNTIAGHKYYFAANFSEKANVYIVAKAGSTSFNTKDEKIFTGDTNFNITLQVERDKVINTDLKPILVDLTRMFGVGKEPQTTQEVQEYLVKGTYYPYDDKPSKAEVNSLSMCPSETFDVLPIIGDYVANTSIELTPYIVSNGYIHLYVVASSPSTFFGEVYGDSELLHQGFTAGFYNSSKFLYVPVSKGQEATLRINQNCRINIANFIHAKEI